MLQTWTSNIATGKPFNEGGAVSFLIGTILGIPMGALGGPSGGIEIEKKFGDKGMTLAPAPTENIPFVPPSEQAPTVPPVIEKPKEEAQPVLEAKAPVIGKESVKEVAVEAEMPEVSPEIEEKAQEAGKYNSTEEFVNKNIFFRGEDFGKDGNFFTKSREFAQEFAGTKPLSEVGIPEQNIYRAKELPDATKDFSKVIQEAKGKGFKALYISEGKPFGKPIESVFVFDKSVIKTKSQLTEEIQPTISEQILEPKKEKTKKRIKPEIKEPIRFTEKFDTPELEARAEIEYQILAEIDTARPGFRVMAGKNEFTGVKSTFPSWVPQELRSTELFASILEHLNANTLPKKANEIRLYNVIAEEINARLGIVDQAALKLNEEAKKLTNDFFGIGMTEQKIDNLLGKTKEEYAKLDGEIKEIEDAGNKNFPPRTFEKEGAEEKKVRQQEPAKQKSEPVEVLDEDDGELVEAHGLSAKKWEVKMALEPEVKETINKTEILTWAEKTFGIPIKGKATHKWKNAGMYYSKKQIIRMEKWGELSVMAHELSHHIDLTMLKNQYPEGWRKGAHGFQTELADLDYDQTKRRAKEGFAEYMRYRLTTDQAAEKAPMFHKFFNEFLDKNSELKTKLDGLKARLDIWHKQGAENRVIQHIDWKGEHTKLQGIVPKIKKAWQFIQEKFNDEFYTPQKIVKQIEGIIKRKLKPTENPATMMEYSKSKAGAIARTFIMENAIEEYGNVIGPSLLEVLKPVPNSEMRQFIAYAVSKRAIDLANRNIESGFDIDDAKFIVEKYKDKGWDTTAKNLTDWSNYILDWLVRAGGLDAKTTQRMRDLNPIYLPFKRAFLDALSVTQGAGGFVDTGVGVKGIKGSGRPIINPIEAMIAQTRELIAKAQKIRIAKLFIDLSTNEGVGGFITEVPAPMKATTFSAEQIKGQIEEDGGEIEDMDSFLTVFTQDFRYNGKENIVSVWKNGEQKFYEIHPDLYESFKGIDPLKLGPVSKLLAPFARMLRLGATGLKVSFGVARNPFRDALSYVVFSERNTATVFDPIKGIYTSLTTKPGELTGRFKQLGGALSGQIGFDRAATMQTYDELLNEKLGKTGKVLKVVKHPIDALRAILSVTEMGPRSVELEQNYKMYREKNPDWSEEDAFVQAFNDAQDVTVNFTKSGKWAKQLNEITAFFNVAIRGPEKLYRAFRNKPIQTFVKGLVWLTLLAIGSWYKNKDKDWYKNLPPAYKYNNLYFEIGDEVFRLPIPFELGTIFMAAPQAALDTMQGDDKAMGGVLEIAKSQIPDPTPSAFGPLIDVASNKNYLGIPIESEGMQNLYPTERRKDFTSRFAIEISKGLDKLGIQVSPIQLDYLLDSYSGGFARQFDKGDTGELADLPILKDIMLRDKNFPRRQVNEFFDDYEVLKQKKQSKIATNEEKRKLGKIDGFYEIYKEVSGKIKEAKKAKNQGDIKRYEDILKNQLKRYGYE